MSIITLELERKIVQLLKDKGCCLRCCLRFIGLRTMQYYEDPISFTQKEGYIDLNKELVSDGHCITCLGILEDNIQASIVDIVQSEVKKQNYDCETFTCTLTIPVAVKLREHALHIYLTKELNLSEPVLHNLKLRLQNIKDIWKWVVLPKIAAAIGQRIDLCTSPFLIEIVLAYALDSNECTPLLNKPMVLSNNTIHRKGQLYKFSRKNMESLLSDITDEKFAQHFTVPPIGPAKGVNVENVMCSHSSIYIGGRYNKFSRELSQTPWFINGEKKKETSVQDILCNPIVEAVQAQSLKFLSSGREDVDVRNIHSGRPFAVELINPHMTNITDELLSNLVTRINDSTQQAKITSNLKILSRMDLKKLKEGETVKSKFYRALCICHKASTSLPQIEKLNNLKNVKIIQNTPIRVLHRRPLSPRTRYVYEMRARWPKVEELKNFSHITEEDSKFFVLDVRTQAGTYVKEFVHGDFGRTKPSLCDLLNAEIDIIALDVTGINLDWP